MVFQDVVFGGNWVKGTLDLFVLFYYFFQRHVDLQWSEKFKFNLKKKKGEEYGKGDGMSLHG